MEVIAVTGAAGYIGQQLVRQLTAVPGVRKILALDVRPAPAPSAKVQSVQFDVTRSMEALFARAGVDTAVHLAFVLNPIHDRARERAINVGGTRRFLDACRASHVRSLLLASSGTAYGAYPDNPPALSEDAPLRGRPGFSYVDDKLEMERLAVAYQAAEARARVLVVRPSVVVGPHVDNYISRFFRRRVSFAFRGVNPPVGVVHEDDVARACVALLQQAPAGAYNLSAPNPITLSEITRRIGTRVVGLPAAVVHPLADVAWRLRLRRLTEAPPDMLDYIRYPWVPDGRKVTQVTDFQYAYDSRGAVDALVRDSR